MATAKPNAPNDVLRRIQDTSRRVRGHDVRKWYAELTRVYGLSVKHQLQLHEPDPRIVVCGSAGEPTIGLIGGPFASFHVNISMPNAILFREFKRWLREVRKQRRSPVAKPGQGEFNDLFDETKFKNWRSTKIIEFAELLTWRAQLDSAARKGLSESTLGEWIKRYTPKDVNKTKMVLKAALSCLPSLAAQVEHELIQTVHDDELVAARIAKEIARQS